MCEVVHRILIPGKKLQEYQLTFPVGSNGDTEVLDVLSPEEAVSMDTDGFIDVDGYEILAWQCSGCHQMINIDTILKRMKRWQEAVERDTEE